MQAKSSSSLLTFSEEKARLFDNIAKLEGIAEILFVCVSS